MKTQFTDEQKQIILQIYVQEGKSLRACADLVGSSPGVIRRFLVEQGVEIRSYALNKKKVDKEKVKDKTYFSKERENANMAWLMGFLASDGSISSKNNSIKIGLSAKDKEILERIREELKLKDNHVSSYTTSNGFDVVELRWTCAQHKQDLARYGIIPNKTFNLKPPYELNSQYYLDFIRGYFDGDGSVSQKQNALCFAICSATKEILEFIIEVLAMYDVPRVKIYEDRRGKNINYYFNYSTNATKQIYNLLYQTNSNLYLKRKKDKFEKLITLKNDIDLQETTHL